jgi:phage N-6-adenine-methyltransferase
MTSSHTVGELLAYESRQTALSNRKMPVQKPGKSKQDYATPRSFIAAVEKKFGKISLDLAANKKNRVCENYLGPDHDNPKRRDAFEVDWAKALGKGKHAWLNPPFADIAPWAKICMGVTRELRIDQDIFFLIPASVGSNYFAEYIFDVAKVLFIRPRLSFDGKDPYPKDLILCVYNAPPGFDTWRWDEEEE